MNPFKPILSGLLRRDVLKLLGASAAALWAGGTRAGTSMLEDLWPKWQQDWRRMEALARRRGWEVEALRIEKRASKVQIARAEKAVGLPFPEQLRQALTQCSAGVHFGWHIPSHLAPRETTGFPNGSTGYNIVWDLDHIRDRALPELHGWKKYLAHQEFSEEPNTPEMWENQFPLMTLVNGDFLTIDVSDPKGPQPVRYFSHELEGLHGRALAPDFFSFVTVLSRLGWAGNTHDDWFAFVAPEDGDKTYLTLEAEGSREWLAFLGKE